MSRDSYFDGAVCTALVGTPVWQVPFQDISGKPAPLLRYFIGGDDDVSERVL